MANGGTILVTTNGGVTWTPQSTGSSQSLNAVTFTDATHGWAVGDNGTILATAAGGWPDTTAPTTTVSGADALWHNAPVTVSFSAADNAGGSGVAKTEYQLDARAWTSGTSLTVSGDGTHTINYRSTDNAGNIEAAKSVIVRVDTRKPTSVATKNVTVTKGRKAKLAFKIDDPSPSCGSAKVTITIKLKKKVVKTITISNLATNKAASYSFKVSLKRGSYLWSVQATDIARNAGKASAARKLIVK